MRWKCWPGQNDTGATSSLPRRYHMIRSNFCICTLSAFCAVEPYGCRTEKFRFTSTTFSCILKCFGKFLAFFPTSSSSRQGPKTLRSPTTATMLDSVEFSDLGEKCLTSEKKAVVPQLLSSNYSSPCSLMMFSKLHICQNTVLRAVSTSCAVRPPLIEKKEKKTFLWLSLPLIRHRWSPLVAGNSAHSLWKYYKK